MSGKGTRERNTLEREDLALAYRFVRKLMSDGQPRDWTLEKEEQSNRAVGHGGRAWDCYRMGGTWALRCIYWYQHERDEPSREWRPSIIMRCILSTAQLQTELGLL